MTEVTKYKLVAQMETNRAMARLLLIALIDEARAGGNPAEVTLWAIDEAQRELELCGCRFESEGEWVTVKGCVYHDG